MKRFILLIVLLCTAGMLHAATGKTYRATVDKDGVQRVSMVGGSYFYDPAHIIVKVNVPVELSVRKDAGMIPHNIVVRAVTAGIDFDEEMGNEAKVIRFTPTKAGKYPIYCSKKLLFFESHREKGMEGLLEVVE
jgi:plastocyanin domain-containing protein